MRPEPIDLSRVSTYPIAERRNKVTLARDFAGLTITGHHEIMIPLLAAGILDRLTAGPPTA